MRKQRARREYKRKLNGKKENVTMNLKKLLRKYGKKEKRR